MTWTHAATLSFAGSGAATLTSGGKTLGQIVINGGVSQSVTLQDALTSSGSISVTQGVFVTNNFNVTATSLLSSGSFTRVISLGGSTVTLSGTTPIDFTTSTGLTFNAGTSTISLSGNVTTFNPGPANLTFHNVSFTNVSTPTTRAFTYTGIYTYNRLTVAAPGDIGVMQVTFAGRNTFNDGLATSGTAGNRRVWFRSATFGIAHTLTINGAGSLTDADFRDLYFIGTAAPISGTRIGDLRGIRGITASTPKTVYWNLTSGGRWSANAWAATSGGAVSTDNFPLAQDTAVIENTGLGNFGTITLDASLPYIGTFNGSTRTQIANIQLGGAAYTVYGDWVMGSGTGFAGGVTLTFSGRNTQTITSAGKQFVGGVVVDSYGGTVQLADALSIGANNISVANGAFDTKNYAVNAGGLLSNSSNVRAISLGSSTVTLSNAVDFANSTNLSFDCGTSTIIFSASSPSPNFGNQTFDNVSFTSGNGLIAGIVGGLTCNNLMINAPSSSGVQSVTIWANLTVNGVLTVAGASATRRIFLRSDTPGIARTLTVNSLSAQDCDFRDITIAGAAAGSSPVRAGNGGRNTGINFPAPKTVYWNLAGTNSWLSLGWCATSGGTPSIDNFPLAQDTAVIDNAGSVTELRLLGGYLVGTLDASARTAAVTLNMTGTLSGFCGNVAMGTGVSAPTTSNIMRFNGEGLQTITSNGVAIGYQVIIDKPTGEARLMDAFSCPSNLSVNEGTFNANNFNVTLASFFCSSSSVCDVRMGTGLWTLTGISGVWTMGQSNLHRLRADQADILLSNTSTSARTFAGGGRYYRKLTIGGATGTSTTTITDNNIFGELASTKTVAHTIALGSNTHTFGKWSVTGTAGNVVTVTGGGISNVIAGPATSGLDYLAMGTIGFASTSQGEFYAGLNSTGGGQNVIRLATPAPRTLFWVGGNGNWDNTARWSTSSGGSGGAGIPTSLDAVIFNSASGASSYIATFNATARFNSLTVSPPASGTLTLAGTANIYAHGSITLPASGLSWAHTGNIFLTGTGAGKTLTTNGISFTNIAALTVDGLGCEWTLGSALTVGTRNLWVTSGQISLGAFSLSCGMLASLSASSPRTINLGSAACTLFGGVSFGTIPSTAHGLSFIAGSSQITLPSAGVGTFDGNDVAFNDVSITSTSTSSVTISGANSFGNLTVSPPSGGVKPIGFNANQTISGTLTLTPGANPTTRTFLRSGTIGVTRTLTCAAVASLTDIDFRDIVIAGAAAPVSGTRLGDCKGNSGITFPASKTVYWRNTAGGDWSSTTGWSATAGGTADVTQFPLAQDVVVLASGYPASGEAVAIDAAYNVGSIDALSQRSEGLLLRMGVSNFGLYGDLKINEASQISYTIPCTIDLAGRTTQYIDTKDRLVRIGGALRINSPGGTVEFVSPLNGDVSVGATSISVQQGGLKLNGHQIRPGDFTAPGASQRFIDFGAGGMVVMSVTSGTVWNASGSNLSILGTGTIRLASSSAKTFAGGGFNYSGITLDNGGAGALTITGNNTFASISNSRSDFGPASIVLASSIQRVASWSAKGGASRVLSISGSSPASPATLIFTGAGQATAMDVDHLNIFAVRAYPLQDAWLTGGYSVNRGSLGWTYAPEPPFVPSSGMLFFFG